VIDYLFVSFAIIDLLYSGASNAKECFYHATHEQIGESAPSCGRGQGYVSGNDEGELLHLET
jgi:hypothetical protein